MDNFVSAETAANLDKFIGLTRIKSRLRKLEELVGIKESLPTFADRAAATTGGLQTGEWYVTSAGQLMQV